MVSRGGSTSLAGQCCNVAVVMDMSKYLNRILELNPEAKIARAEPGCVLDNLRDTAERHHLTFAPDPSTHTHITLGGMIGNNSCGVHSLIGGKTVEDVIELDVLLYDGIRMKVDRTDEKEFERIVGEGCIHTRIDFDLETEAGVRAFHAFLNETADLVVSYGGSLSGGHGNGQSKAELLPKMFDEELVQAFREFKSI